MAKKHIPSKTPTRDVNKGLILKKPPLAGRPSKSSPGAKARTSIKSPHPEKDRSKEKFFPLVGIGASAGGLEAFTKLLENLSPDTGMAFVLVQHLAPTKDSILAELLSKATTMPVREVQDGMTVEPDHVYVIPPNALMAVFNGALRLQPRAEPHTQHMPVDYFFRSLAQDQGQNAVGIILSGTGSDGSLGMRAIKAEGGIVMAQDEQSAKYDGMPKSAAATGAVDYILPPEKIAAELARISRHPVMTPHTGKKNGQLLAGEDDLNRIFMLIRTSTGADFTYYKHSTILRRIHRRMLLHKIDALEQYVCYLQENPPEVGILYQDILINVTSFFRDPETFNALKNVVFPRILEKRPFDTPIRVWVPACSTGEETYSLAMCFSEFSEERSVSHPIQYFASDLDEAAIEKARQGIYPENIAQDVSPERLRRFFTRTEQGYQISKAIREQCVFARQNIIKDPPFSKMELISCRNLMIYFGPMLQKKVLPILHYALNQSGYLMLGKSESIGEFSDLFSVVDKSSGIYSKKTSSRQLHFRQERTLFKEKPGLKNKKEEQAPGGSDIQKAADSIILGRYSPAGLVINEDLDILQFRGNISPYLKPQPGKASLNLVKMAGESLAMELRVLIRRAGGKDIAVRKEGVKVRHNNLVTMINIEVIAFKTRDPSERLFLVIFEDTAAPAVRGSQKAGKPPAKTKGRSQEEQVAPLARELADTRQHLKSVIEEYEASSEELKALNEEMQSSNEELQSINEELETSKEELQSTNEELSTVNDELQNRNNEISQINNDLVNVLSGVEIPILLIGNKLQIRRFNTAAEKVLNLIASDIGRPISDIRPNINTRDLDKMIIEVIDSVTVRQQELQNREGRWYSMTIRPYKTIDNRIDGALVTFEDINDLKQGMMRVQEARDYAEAIVETVRESLIVLTKDLHVVTANQAYYRNFGVKPDVIENKSFYELQNGLWNIPKLRELLEDILVKNSIFNDFEVTYEAAGVDTRVLLINARTVISKDPAAHLILLAIEDVTSRRLAEEALRESENRYRSLFENMLNGYAYCKMLYEDGRPQDFIYLEVNREFENLTGLKNVVGKKVSEVIPGIRESDPVLLEIYGRVALTGKPESFEIYLEPLAAWFFVSVYSTEKGYFVAVFDNITERKRTESITEARLRMLSMAASPSISRDEILQKMLDEIEKQLGSVIGFYHFLDVDQETLSLQAWSTSTLRNMCTAEGKGSHYNISQAGVWVDCVRERGPVIHNDYASLAHRRGLPPGHAAVKREMVVPILRGGLIVAIIGVGNKPTDYNETDVQIAQFLGELSWEIFERIRAVDELQKAHAKIERRTQELAATNKELEAFTYSVSHDLRAPLNGVSGFSQILYEDYADKLDTKGKDYLARIKNGSNRMGQLIEDLLRLSHISRQKVERIDYDLSSLVSDVMSSLREAEPARNVDVVIAEGLRAVVDPNLMNIALTNLLNNAWKFTSRAENARIEFGAMEEDAKTVYFVKDNGAGFDATYAEKMFLPFQRLHPEKDFEGTGIGLAIVERIIRHHAGKVYAEGEVGIGATIYFTLGQ